MVWPHRDSIIFSHLELRPLVAAVTQGSISTCIFSALLQISYPMVPFSKTQDSLSLVIIFFILMTCTFDLAVIERFSNECRKTRTKVITPANHNKHKLPDEPIRTRSKHMQPAPSAGKRVRASCDWFEFYL